MFSARTTYGEIFDDEAFRLFCSEVGDERAVLGLAWPQPLTGQHLHPPLTGYDH